MSQTKQLNPKPKLRQRKTRKEREEILKNRMGLQFLSHKELTLLKNIFKSLDKDNSGYINKEEFDKALNSYGISFDEGKIMNLFNETDKNGSKAIDFDEFLNSIASELKMSEETLRQVFGMIVENDNDYITIEDLKKLNSVYNEEELKELIDSTDSTHSGKVNFEDFYKMITTKI